MGRKVRIAVDLDGVVYEWQRTYRYMMREYRGVELPPVEDFWFYWNAPDQFTTPEDRKWMWSEGVRRGLFRYGHMWKGARIGLEALRDAGYALSIVTHRPEQAVSDTLEWAALYLKDIPLYGFSILSNGEAKTDVPWDILVDDKPENIDDALDAGREGLLFDQPWNRNRETGCRVRGWSGVREWFDVAK